MIKQSSAISLRPMEEDDLSLLHLWLQRSHVIEWWGGEDARLDFDQVREKYLPRLKNPEPVTSYIAMLDGTPIGYAQSYIALGCGEGWWEDETDPGVRGIDLFLSEGNQLSQGIGTKLVQALVRHLFTDQGVTKIQTDPDPRNLRAIRCYEKAGFRAVRTIVTPDGLALYMVQERNTHMLSANDR
jgi:AacA4 family aminoglycoside N(6')-acetyltransferase